MKDSPRPQPTLPPPPPLGEKVISATNPLWPSATFGQPPPPPLPPARVG